MHKPCVFCEIIAGRVPASVIFEDALCLALVDLRQFHPGHVLVIPRRHLPDVRELDASTGAALMVAIAAVTRAVSTVFPNQGLSLWHSIGEAAFQEVPHLHFHVHPRRHQDQLLRIYPEPPPTPDRAVLDGHAQRLRAALQEDAYRP
jgi:histidine triad (HIT) family protein